MPSSTSNNIYRDKVSIECERIIGYLLSYKGPLSGLFLTFTSFFGLIFCLFPFAPFIFVAPRIWRLLCDHFCGLALHLPVSIVDLWFDTEFDVTGDKVDRKRPGLMIMNHPTRMDWLFLWNALYRMDPLLLASHKLSLKSSLKWIPGPVLRNRDGFLNGAKPTTCIKAFRSRDFSGWAMQCTNWIFLERKWDVDRDSLTDAVQYYSDIGIPYQILLFPEGTDLSQQNRQRMETYAKKSGLPVYQHLLHPRLKGTVHILQQMKQRKYLDFVYDVVVAYDGPILQSEMAFLRDSATPAGVQFHVDKYSVDQIPDEEEDIVKWLRSVWDEKEKILAHFYGQQDGYNEDRRNLSKAVNDVRRKTDVSPIDGFDRFGNQTDSETNQTHFDNPNQTQLARIIGGSYWLCMLLWIFHCLCQIWNFLWAKVCFALFIGAFMYVVQFRCGGMEKLIIQLNKEERKRNEMRKNMASKPLNLPTAAE